MIAGYFGGRTDNIIMRGVDMLMAFPYILLALAIVAALGPGLMNALIAVAAVNIPFFARNIRGVTVTLAGREFVDAARLAGMGHVRIMLSRTGSQCNPGDRHRHVDNNRLDDSRNCGPVIPGARQPASASGPGFHAG